MPTSQQDTNYKPLPSSKMKSDAESKSTSTAGRKSRSVGKPARRGRPPKVDHVGAARLAIRAALAAVQKASHNSNPDAERQLSAYDWPLIRVMRQTAHDDHISAWQVVKLALAGVVYDEIAVLEAWGRIDDTESVQRIVHEELVFLRDYVLNGQSLAAVGETLGCDASRVMRALKKPIYDRLVEGVLLALGDERIQSPNLVREILVYGTDRANRVRRMR